MPHSDCVFTPKHPRTLSPAAGPPSQNLGPRPSTPKGAISKYRPPSLAEINHVRWLNIANWLPDSSVYEFPYTCRSKAIDFISAKMEGTSASKCWLLFHSEMAFQLHCRLLSNSTR